MSVVLSSAIESAGEQDGVSLRYPRIAVTKRTGTVTASTEATDFPASRADTPHTYGGWKPTAVPATWEIDLGSDQVVNYCGIAGHNIGSSGGTVQVQYLDDSSSPATWEDLTDSETPSDDEAILFLFANTTAQQFRIRLSGSIATISVIKFGVVHAPERGMRPSFGPAVWNPRTEYTNQVSEGGQILGRLKVRRGLRQTIQLNEVDASWAEANWPDLRADLENEGVFFSWAPEDQSEHVIYGMTRDEPSAEYSSFGGFVTISIPLAGP